MKFEDIQFNEVERVPYGIQALLDYGKYELSIIQNDMSYGGKMGLYEIGVFQGENMVELPGITREGDTVNGYLSEDNVTHILRKMFLITAKEPKQV